jgi:16S rRNA (guanine527-N7)-methyltransferase
VLDAGLEALGLRLTVPVRRALEGQARLLIAWNEHVNLTALRTPDQIALEHVVDSLTAVPVIRQLLRPTETPSILDLGSGAGYPGLPVGLVLPAGSVTLLDSVRKKARFLEAVSAAAMRALGSEAGRHARVRAHVARAEQIRPRVGDGASDLVLARAVAPLPRLIELAFPLIRAGGWLVAWKREGPGGALMAEVGASMDALRGWGVQEVPQVVPVEVEGLEDHRLVLLRRPRRLARHG